MSVLPLLASAALLAPVQDPTPPLVRTRLVEPPPAVTTSAPRDYAFAHASYVRLRESLRAASKLGVARPVATARTQ